MTASTRPAFSPRLTEMQKAYRRRRDLVCERLNAMPRLACLRIARYGEFVSGV